MSGAGGFLGGLSTGFADSFKATREKKKDRELEQQRMAKQDAQFQQQLTLQRDQLNATNTRNDLLDKFMMQRGNREDARLDTASTIAMNRDQRDARDAYWKEIQNKALLGDPTMLQKEVAARGAKFDADIAQSESYIRTLPLTERRAWYANKLDESNLDKAALDNKMATMNYEDAQRLKPFRDKLVEAQAREADARSKMSELDLSDAPQALERKKISEHINLLHGAASMVSQLANIQATAQENHLKTLQLDNNQINELSQRWVDLVTRAQIAPNDATKLITDLYKTGHGVINKDIASRTGASPAEHMELMRWYADATGKVLKGSPEEVKQVMGELPAVTQKFMGAFADYGAEQKQKQGALGPSGIPYKPGEGGEPAAPPPPKPTNFKEFAAGNPGRVSNTAAPMTLQMEDIPRLVFSKPGLKEAAGKALKTFYKGGAEGQDFTDDQIAGWLMRELNKHPEIKGDTATRAAKLIESIPNSGVGSISPFGNARSSGGGEPQSGGRTPGPTSYGGGRGGYDRDGNFRQEGDVWQYPHET